MDALQPPSEMGLVVDQGLRDLEQEGVHLGGGVDLREGVQKGFHVVGNDVFQVDRGGSGGRWGRG